MTGYLAPVGAAASVAALAGEVQGPPALRPAATAYAADVPAAAEDVTLSELGGQVTALKDAAAESDGIDHAMVAQIRNAIQSGTYNVSPEDLAQAIANVLKDSA